MDKPNDLDWWRKAIASCYSLGNYDGEPAHAVVDNADDLLEEIADLRAKVADLEAKLGERDREIERLEEWKATRMECDNDRKKVERTLRAKVVELNAKLGEKDRSRDD